jgi:hypothetical protein
MRNLRGGGVTTVANMPDHAQPPKREVVISSVIYLDNFSSVARDPASRKAELQCC